MSAWDSTLFDYRQLAVTTPAMSRPGWGLKRITDAASEPVSLNDAKTFLSIDSTNTAWDALISALIIAARTRIEEETGRALITQTWRLALDQFPNYTKLAYPAGLLPILLPRPPFLAINITSPNVGLSYVDGNGVTQQLTMTTDFLVDANKEPAEIQPAYGKTWPATRRQGSAVMIDYDCGYGPTFSSVPEPFKQAIKLLVGNWFENRESVVSDLRAVAVELPQSALWLVEPYKVLRFWEQ